MTTTTHATGSLKTKSWNEEPYAEIEGAPKLSHDRVVQVITGDIEGEGTWQGLNAYSGDAAAIYVGFERVVGKVGGRSGNFVIQVSGTYENGEARVSWSIVPGTGTGELSGLRGEGGYVAGASDEDGYSYWLDYRFE